MDRGRHRLAEVFEREKVRFLAFVYRKLDGLAAMEAEDIVADVTYRLLRRADLMEEVDNLTAYIYRSLANRIADLRRGTVPMVSLDPQGQDAPALPITPEDPGPDPEAQYLQKQLREHLREAIGRLGPKERAIWVATEIHGCSFRELADKWDEPLGTLLSRKSRATARLREMLSEFENLTLE